MAKLERFRRLYFRDGLSLSQIARKTGFARNTVKTWLRAAEGIEPRYRRREGQSKISPFTELLTKALETDARRPKRDRRSALKLHAELKAVGFPGDYSRVTEFVRRSRRVRVGRKVMPQTQAEPPSLGKRVLLDDI